MNRICFVYPVCRRIEACAQVPGGDLGLLPPRSWLQENPWDCIILHEQVWHPGDPDAKTPGGPYLPWRRDEVERFAADCHAEGHKVLIYASPYYWWRRLGQADAVPVLPVLRDLLAMGVDGWYLDYLLPDREASRALLDALRRDEPTSIIVAHVSHVRSAGFDAMVWPEVEEPCDLVADGERVPFDAGFFRRVTQHVRPWIWHAGPLVEFETNRKAYQQDLRHDGPELMVGVSELVIGWLAPTLGAIIPGWSAPRPSDGGYTWSSGTSPRYRAYRDAL